MYKILITFTIVLLAGSVCADTIHLEKRHQLGLKVGMWNQTTNNRTEIGIGGVETSVGANGAMGGIFYGQWLQENLALTFCITGMALDITTNTGITGVLTETSTMSSILLGMKYYPVRSTLDRSLRPYVKFGAGPFIGSQSSNRVGLTVVNESRTELAFGGLLGGGADIVLGRHIMVGFGLGYNLMTDFGNPIGGSSNYSGPEFGFELSWLLGRGVE